MDTTPREERDPLFDGLEISPAMAEVFRAAGARHKEEYQILSISFPFVDGSVEKVSYASDNSSFYLYISAGSTGLLFREQDVVFTEGTDVRPVLDAKRLLVLEQQRDAGITRCTIAIPYVQGSLDEVSHSHEGNYLHITCKGSMVQTFDLDAVSFTRTRCCSLGHENPESVSLCDECGEPLSISRNTTQPLDAERHADDPYQVLQRGDTLSGVITNIVAFGVFVELTLDSGSVTGLAHVSELEKAGIGLDSLTRGQGVTVRVLRVDRERKRVGLSLLPAQTSGSKSLMTQVATSPITIDSLLRAEGADPVASSFVDLYLKRLTAAAREVPEIKDGLPILPRWTVKEENSDYHLALSYGYNPAEVAFCLKLLNDLLTAASRTQSKLVLSKEMLLGFSCVLGYYNLYRYLLQLPERVPEKQFLTSVEVAERQHALWFQGLCDLSKPYPQVETGSDRRVIAEWLEQHMPQLKSSLTNISSDDPCVYHASGSYPKYYVYEIVDAETKRFVAFIKSLRMLINVLTPVTLPSTERNTKQSGTQAAVRVKRVTHQKGAHTYHLLLTDSEFLRKAYPFKLTIPPDDEVTLEEEVEEDNA